MSLGSALEHAMLTLVNAERAKHGLKPLMMERRLNDAAEDHSRWMLDQDVVDHTGAGGSTATDRMRAADFDFRGSWSSGEGIALRSLHRPDGLADDMRTLHQDLMSIPSHRANILRPEFEVVGIGIEVGEYQGRQALMITQNFADTEAELRIEGHDGHDILRSGKTGDWLYGRGGDDLLFGKGGADRIKGQKGDDKLLGGGGQRQAPRRGWQRQAPRRVRQRQARRRGWQRQAPRRGGQRQARRRVRQRQARRRFRQRQAPRRGGG